jgi:hypothetical protein
MQHGGNLEHPPARTSKHLLSGLRPGGTGAVTRGLSRVYGDFRAAAGMLSLQPGNRSPVVQVTGKRQIGESHARPNSPIACPVRWFFQARSAGIMVGSAHCGCGDPLPVFPDALCGQMNMSIARIRNLLYRVARYLGDVNTLQRGRVSTRIIRRVAGLSSERFLLR